METNVNNIRNYILSDRKKRKAGDFDIKKYCLITENKINSN